MRARLVVQTLRVSRIAGGLSNSPVVLRVICPWMGLIRCGKSSEIILGTPGIDEVIVNWVA